jgi:alkanesulfonate monooxygenase SsuD/methylene tetrahydromethanopterin reductase-like flavin-dependent oxidoreductase (luciferase family)
MEFGIFQSLYLPHTMSEKDPLGAEHARLMDEVEWLKAADRSGFKYSWSAEHHFLTEYSHMSASEAFLGYAAAVTERIHLGTGIFNITPPVNHPARIAERVAMLDQLSKGRFEFGTGRGSSSTEYMGFSIPNSDLTREMFDEVLPQFVRMWSERDYSFEGRFFSMPKRTVHPSVYQKPHPPIWVAAGSPSTFEKAGRMGIGVLCFANEAPEKLAPLIETYKKAVADAEPVGAFVNDNIMVTSQMLCLEDGKRAREVFCNATVGYQNSLVFHYLDTFPKPSWVPQWPELIPEPTPDALEHLISQHQVCVGDPEEVQKAVQRYYDIGADQLSFGMLSSSMPIEVAVEATETFGRHIIPQFDRDPVHRTTRMREAYLAEIGEEGMKAIAEAERRRITMPKG